MKPPQASSVYRRLHGQLRRLRGSLAATPARAALSAAQRDTLAAQMTGRNAQVAAVLQASDLDPLLVPLRDAFFAIPHDPDHPLRADLLSDRQHWFAKDFGLNDLALDAGYVALGQGNLGAARAVAGLIRLTGFSGAKTLQFLAQSSSANSEIAARVLAQTPPAAPRTRKDPRFEPTGFAPVQGLKTPCPACVSIATHHSDYPSDVRPFVAARVLYCTACGLGFVPGMDAVLAQYYKRDYAALNRGDRGADPAAYFRDLSAGSDPKLAKYTERVRRQIALLKEHGAGFGTVLDYGSGPGYFLHACGAQQAHAIEPDEMSHKYLAYLGAQVHSTVGTLPVQGIDSIVASHAIEHLPAEGLAPTLAALMRALAPAGRMLIEVPQGGHSYLHLGGHRQDPHTLFFTGKALTSAIEAAGGRILFQRAMGRVDSPRRDDPVYVPPDSPPFHRTQRGSLTVVCTPA